MHIRELIFTCERLTLSRVQSLNLELRASTLAAVYVINEGLDDGCGDTRTILTRIDDGQAMIQRIANEF